MGEIMSEETKYELAEELGFADKVKDGDWGQITTREAGSLVRRAIEKVEENMDQQNQNQVLQNNSGQQNQQVPQNNSVQLNQAPQNNLGQ